MKYTISCPQTRQAQVKQALAESGFELLPSTSGATGPGADALPVTLIAFHPGGATEAEGCLGKLKRSGGISGYHQG